jgi:hypothetical protein
MAQAGFTPISLYYSNTASSIPTAGNLVNGELSINITDGVIYYKNNLGVVVPYTPTGVPAGATTQVQYNNAGVTAGSPNLTFNGTTTTALQLVASGSATLAAFKTPNIKEVATISNAAGGALNYDITTQSVQLYSIAATSNFTVNFRGSSTATLNSIMAVGESMSVTLLNTNGAAAFYLTAITIDGVAQTVKWQGGTAPASGNASSVDAYTFAIIKTAASTYTVIGSQTQFA